MLLLLFTLIALTATKDGQTVYYRLNMNKRLCITGCIQPIGMCKIADNDNLAYYNQPKMKTVKQSVFKLETTGFEI